MKRQIAPALLIILLIAFVLRIFQLDAQSLWWDEGISLHLATSSLAEIWADRAQRLHPPGYFILLKGWLSLVGVSPFTGRYLPVLASWVQVTAVYTLTRTWFAKHPHGRWIVWLSTLLITLSPLSIIYGQETRVYALLPLVYLTMLLATNKILKEYRSRGFSRNALNDPAKASTPVNRWKWWIVLGLAEWIGIHLHYITFFAGGDCECVVVVAHFLAKPGIVEALAHHTNGSRVGKFALVCICVSQCHCRTQSRKYGPLFVRTCAI